MKTAAPNNFFFFASLGQSHFCYRILQQNILKNIAPHPTHTNTKKTQIKHYILHKNNDQNMINYIPLKFPQTFTCELINLSIRGKNIYLIFKIEHC